MNEIALLVGVTLSAAEGSRRIRQQAGNAVSFGMTWDQALAMEEFAEPNCFTTADHRDAVSSFLAR